MADVLADLDVEQQFLGVLASLGANDPSKARTALDQSLVVPERLFLPAHRDTLAAMADLLAAGNPIDAGVLWVRLRTSEAVRAKGGMGWLVELCGSVAGSVESLPTYAETIRLLALRRLMDSIGEDIRAKAHDLKRPIEDTLIEKTSALAAITLSRKGIKTLTDVLSDCIADMEEARSGRQPRMVPTGLLDLDNLLGGGLPPTLVIVGALPGVGKSALFASIVNNAARQGFKVGIFSLEDEARWLGWRLLAAEANLPQALIKSGALSGYQIERVSNAMGALGSFGGNVLIDDRCGMTASEIVQSATDMIVNRGAKCILVDHAGEIAIESAGSGDRHDLALTRALQLLRDVAKSRGVPVVVASHLKRKPGQTQADKPTLTDFKNTSSLEGMARVAIGLSRDPDPEHKVADVLNVHVLKHTNGQIADLQMKFKGLAGMVFDCEGAGQRNWYAEEG